MNPNEILEMAIVTCSVVLLVVGAWITIRVLCILQASGHWNDRDLEQ